jgi:hypothetical protein
VQIAWDHDSFITFPYPPKGNENKGGFDLLSNPEKIDEITEFEKFPELRQFIEFLNFESKKYRSFGCDGGQDGDIFAGYIEFAFRNSEEASKLDLYEALVNEFEKAVCNEYPPEEASTICNCLKFGKAKIYFEGKPFGIKLSLFFIAPKQAAAAQLLEIFFRFLRQQERSA